MRNEAIIHPKRNQLKVILPTNLTFAHKRLIKDLQQIQNDSIPLCGVSARPLQTNIMTWHANLRGPKKTRFEGAVFHLQIKFPENYPAHPPTIRALSHIVHPNVFGGYFCLDFLNLSKQKLRYSSYEWNPIYSLQSILYQLQGFLKNENIPYDQIANSGGIGNTNLFRCNECMHKGAADPWPPFDENDSKLINYRMAEETLKLECSQLRCFYTKLNFTENQLGLGLNISKIPKTGMIKEAIIFEDYISIKALLKQSIRQTINKQKITHWIPLYFGKVDCHEKFFHFFKKSLSMVMTNSTKYFKPEFILEILPKILINLVYQLMDRNKYLSINLIRIFTYIHSIFLYCIKNYPQLQQKIKQSLRKFYEDEEYRTKDHTPNLGCFLAYLLVTDSYKFSDIIQVYFGEQLDRHVFWILKGVPELISSQLAQNADSVRNELAFNCQKTSFHIICFYHLFLSHCQKRKSKIELLGQYEQNLCRFKMDEENQLQNEIFDIFKTVKSFPDYFRYIALPQKSEAEVNEMLRQAIKNSQKKNYHNSQDVLRWEQSMNLKKSAKVSNKILQKMKPKINIAEQIIHYYQTMPSYQKYITVKFPQQKEEESIQKVQYSQIQSREEDWKQLCLNRWPWIKQCLISDHSLNVGEVSQLAFQFYRKGVTSNEERLYKLHEKYQDAHSKIELPQVLLPQITWKKLFLRLDLEDFLKYFDINTNFPKFYEKLYVCCRNEVNTLVIPLIDIKNLKSGYFYITALLTRLTSLKFLQFACLPFSPLRLHEKIAKAIGKGFHNFYQKKGQLQILSFYNVNAEKDISDHLFKKGYFSDSIKSFRMDNCNLLTFSSAMKYFTSLNYPQLEEISIKRCQMSSERCKTLADLLIKLKKLKIFRMNQQKDLQKGISSIISNLAFNCTLRIIDIGQITICEQGGDYQTQAVQNVIENLGKLIKINSNLEYLILNDIPSLNCWLGRQFWQNLGQSISLKMINISHKISNNSLTSKLNELGRAVAFNAKKKGALQFINFSGCVSGFKSIEDLHEGMKISQYDEQQWYGSANKLKEMIPENYEKKFYNKLQGLNFSFCPNMNMGFSLQQHQQLFNAEEPAIVKLLAESQQLQTLNLKKTGMNKNIADLLFLSLDQKRQGLKSQIKVLNLSQNAIGSEGACTLANMLKQNDIIQILDLSKTQIGVSGIHEISLAFLRLKPSLRYLNVFNNKIGFDGTKSIVQNIVVNAPNLQFLEVGHNRIRGKGLRLLIDAILANPESKMKILGLRFNFLSNMAIISCFKRIAESNNTSLKEIFLRNNLIDDFGLGELSEIANQNGLNIFVDILNKSKYLSKQTSDKTVWIHPIGNLTIPQIKQFFEVKHQCGVIINIRIKTGKKIPNKKKENKFCFIEFADDESTRLALSLAANKYSEIYGVKFRIFKSGSGTFVYHKKSAKLIRREQAQKNLPQANLPIPHANKKIVVATKIKKASVDHSNPQAQALKCEERYLDQIKPQKRWKKKMVFSVVVILILMFWRFMFFSNQENNFVETSIE